MLMYHSHINCVNCGQKGHIIRDCIEPITSLGILLFKITNDKSEEINDVNDELKKILECNDEHKQKIKFLLVQRRDTMGYTDFLRGRYNDEKLMYTFLDEMTIEEKIKLKTCTFDTLWDSLWSNKNGKIYKNEYSFAKHKFENLDIEKILKKSQNIYTFQEFSIPKGRRNINEKDRTCAERELYEETGYSRDMYIYLDKNTIVENFIGTDGINYKHIYYVARLKSEYINYMPQSSSTQNMEIKNKGWFSINECQKIIRPYDTEKIKILQEINRFMNDALKKRNFSIF